MMRASIFRLSPLFLLAVALMALAVFLVHDAQPAAAQWDEATLCPSGADSSLNPTDLRAFGGNRVLTLGWINPETNRGMQYAVRWRKDGTAAWLNPNGAVGEVFHQQPRYTHDITGLEYGAAYDAQVRVILTTHPDGQTGPHACSGWVSVIGTPQAAATADRVQILSATLTVADIGGTWFGCDNTETGKECSSKLTDNTFTYGGVDYAIPQLLQTVSGTTVGITLDKTIPDNLDNLVLHVGGMSLLLADGNKLPGLLPDDTINWTNTDPTWSAGDTVAVSLTAPPPPTGITTTASGALREGGPPVNVFLTLDHPALAGGGATLGASIPADDTTSDWWVRWNPEVAQGAAVSVMQMYVPEDDDDNNCRKRSYGATFDPQVAGGVYLSADFSVTVVDNDGTADTCTGELSSSSSPSQNSPSCDNCGTGGDTGAVSQGQAQYADLIARMKEWRNDPEWAHLKEHTDRWDRALLAFGETVEDTTLSPMTAAEAQGFADKGWERWVEVAKALRVLENQAPTVSSAIAGVTIVSDSGSHEVSLSGVFDDADGDALTINAASDDEATATASVASDGSSLKVTARLRGTATITVTANDGKGGTVDDSFTVTVKAAPLVVSALPDVSGLAAGDTQDVSLSGVFSDADGDQLTITAASSDEARATVTVASGGSSLTLSGVAEGTATVTVTAEDSDGNRVSDAFQVEVVKRFASLIARMYQWRNDPQWVSEKAHTDRWDRALLAFGETVADATLTPMTAAEAQALADQSWGARWVPVAKALWELQNRAPTVAAAMSDVTIVNRLGTHAASLAGVFSDADNDSLSVTAASSNEAVATVSVAADGTSLTVNAQARGTATITVTANDGKGGTVEDSFTVTVKAAPDVASDIADVSGLEAGSTRDVSLSGVFSDADGDALTVTASSDDEAIATVSVAADHSALTVAGVAEGTATVTVIAQDTDGNRVMDDFDVSVVVRQQQQQTTPNQAPTVSAAIADATTVSESGTKQVSLSGVFSDADNDSLTVTAASSDEAKATVSVAADYSSLTVNAKARGTATITVTANDGRGGTVSDAFTVTVKAAPVVASALADLSLEEGATPEVSLSGVFSDADGDALTVTTDTTDENVVNAFAFQDTLYVTAFAAGTATITVTARDSDGNTVSDTFDVSVVAPPTPVSNLTCVAQTGRVLFSWDAPEWSGAAAYAYDYDLTLPDGRREQSRLFGYPAVSGKGEYQAGQQAGISVKAVYELADGSQVSSAAATLTCTVKE